MTRPRALLILALVIGSGVAVLARDVKITPYATSETRVLVTFSARDSWNLATRDVLQTGFQLIFDYEIELRRPQPFWFFDSVLARARVSATAKFDTLTGRYAVSRMRSGSIVKSEFRESEADVKEWLTAFEQVELESVTPLQPNSEYSVRVALSIWPRRSPSLLSLLPFGREENTGRQTFIYIK